MFYPPNSYLTATMDTDFSPHPNTPISYSMIPEPQWPATEADPTPLSWDTYATMLQDTDTVKKWFQYLKDMEDYKGQVRQLSAQYEQHIASLGERIFQYDQQNHALD